MSGERPGGWVEGIGWVARVGALSGRDVEACEACKGSGVVAGWESEALDCSRCDGSGATPHETVPVRATHGHLMVMDNPFPISEYRERLEAAVADLTEQSFDTSRSDDERARLKAKATGVALALSYWNEHEPASAPAGGGDSALRERTDDLYPYLVVGVETGHDLHRTLHGAVADAEGRIEDCLDDTWSDEVDEILVARVTHRAVRTVLGRRGDMAPEAWTTLTGGRTDVDEWWIYSIEPVDPTPAVTDDLSTNSGEPICVVDDCTWPARYGDYCNGHKRMTGFTPSPVLDSERPDTDLTLPERAVERILIQDQDQPFYLVARTIVAALAPLAARPTPEGDERSIRFYVDRDAEPSTLCDHLCGEDSSGRYVLAAIPRDVADELMRQLAAATPEGDQG